MYYFLDIMFNVKNNFSNVTIFGNSNYKIDKICFVL